MKVFFRQVWHPGSDVTNRRGKVGTRRGREELELANDCADVGDKGGRDVVLADVHRELLEGASVG